MIERINANDTRTAYAYTSRSELESIVNYQDRSFYGKVLSSYGYLYNARGERIYQVVAHSGYRQDT